MTPTEALQTALTQLAQAQGRTQQLDALTVQTHDCCDRVDAFVAEVQQDLTQHNERIDKVENITNDWRAFFPNWCVRTIDKRAKKLAAQQILTAGGER